MNSQPDHRTPMLNPQYYDDTKLQRRTKFLVSGLLLCFVIGVANLGISVMLLMKNQDKSEMVQYAKTDPQTQEVKTDLDAHRKEIEALQKKVDIFIKYLKDAKITAGEDGVAVVVPPAQFGLQEGLPTESDDSHGGSHSHDHGGHDHGEHDHGGHDHGGHDHGGHDHGAMPDYLHADLLDKNFDLYFPNEGASGDGDDYDTAYDTEADDYDTDTDEGSGALAAPKCMAFPEPFCPEAHQVCWTDDVCPVPFCCSSEDV